MDDERSGAIQHLKRQPPDGPLGRDCITLEPVNVSTCGLVWMLALSQAHAYL